MNLVSAWQNFYVIVGSSGGALIGIRNAWDSVTYVAIAAPQGDATKPE